MTLDQIQSKEMCVGVWVMTHPTYIQQDGVGCWESDGNQVVGVIVCEPWPHYHKTYTRGKPTRESNWRTPPASTICNVDWFSVRPLSSHLRDQLHDKENTQTALFAFQGDSVIPRWPLHNHPPAPRHSLPLLLTTTILTQAKRSICTYILHLLAKDGWTNVKHNLSCFIAFSSTVCNSSSPC